MNGGKKIQINVQVKNYSAVTGLEKMRTMLFPLVYTNEVSMRYGLFGSTRNTNAFGSTGH